MVHEIVLEVGSEGGSLKVLRERLGNKGWQFRVSTNEAAGCDLLSEEDRCGFENSFTQDHYADSFEQALGLMDRYRWIELFPLEVHPDFRDAVLREVNKRGGQIAERRWREILGRH